MKDIFRYNSLVKDRQNTIKKSLVIIDHYSEDIYKDKKDNIDKYYFHWFLLLIYNLRRLILIREKSNTKKEDK